MIDVKNKVFLVTGSTSGVGLAFAEKLVNAGAFVVFHSRKSQELGAELASKANGSIYIQADLTNKGDICKLTNAIIEKYDGIDYIINNASYSIPIQYLDFEAASPEHWHEMYQINVVSPWMISTSLFDATHNRSCKRKMKSILNISSHAGVFAKGASIPYAVSKSALNHLTKLLAKTFGPKVRVNAVAPGLIDTPLTKSWVEVQKIWKTNSTLQRSAQPEELASFGLNLILEENMTGQIIVWDGGFNL
ncbi:MAG: SDR family oxidoreductase [Pseudomonadota bacterium]|nr:SDR family oxidoreductase [Pseudomonadota bacterium]